MRRRRAAVAYPSQYPSRMCAMAAQWAGATLSRGVIWAVAMCSVSVSASVCVIYIYILYQGRGRRRRRRSRRRCCSAARQHPAAALHRQQPHHRLLHRPLHRLHLIPVRHQPQPHQTSHPVTAAPLSSATSFRNKPSRGGLERCKTGPRQRRLYSPLRLGPNREHAVRGARRKAESRSQTLPKPPEPPYPRAPRTAAHAHAHTRARAPPCISTFCFAQI